jgi:hypothetical protein
MFLSVFILFPALALKVEAVCFSETLASTDEFTRRVPPYLDPTFLNFPLTQIRLRSTIFLTICFLKPVIVFFT